MAHEEGTAGTDTLKKGKEMESGCAEVTELVRGPHPQAPCPAPFTDTQGGSRPRSGSQTQGRASQPHHLGAGIFGQRMAS